jgi:hypothetical protein
MRPHLCPCECCRTSTDLITVYCAGKATAEESMIRQEVEKQLELVQRENTMLLLQLRSERNKSRKETKDVATSTDSEATSTVDKASWSVKATSTVDVASGSVKATSSESLSSTQQRRRGSSPECGRAGKRQRMSDIDDSDDLYS